MHKKIKILSIILLGIGIISFFIFFLFCDKTKENGLVLERNANIESTDLICRCAFYNEREDIYNLFIDMRNLFRTQGYIKSTKGSIEETFEEIFMHDKYKKIRQEIDLDEIDRLRYGLNISEETRKRILRKN